MRARTASAFLFVVVGVVTWRAPEINASSNQSVGAVTLSGLAGEVEVEPILPIPPLAPQNTAKLAAGERLFRDVRISHDNSLSCNTCHHLDAAGVDGLQHSARMDKSMTAMNTTSIFNVSLNFRLFWNGRTKSLEEQIETPRDTQTDWQEVLTKLRQDPEYQLLFAKAYPEQGMTVATLKDAVVTFERALVTPGARLDRYLLGDASAISAREKAGYRLFKSYGCSACHQGVNVGGNMYQKIGIMSDFFEDRAITEADLGRFNLTHDENDRYVFRVPSLRNVAVTAPYFHDGSIKTLSDAINEMAEHQLGRAIPPQDVNLIEEFLHTLTGEYQGKLLHSDNVK